MARNHRYLYRLLFPSLATLVGCGAGSALRPEQPTAADATGRSTVAAVEGPSSPLIVDWKAEQRADLEEVIHDGIAVVSWDKQGLRLLKRCHVAGDYGYLPVSVKKDVVRLETADDVQASLPLGGLGIAGKIGGGFSSGTTLDIALAMVGKRRTTWNDVTQDELTGKCDGATHYVRAILVGAFAMKTGSRAKAAAAAEIFGAGTSGESSSSKDVATSDGKLDACEGTTGNEETPPAHCQAILRLELEPIAKAGTSPTKQPEKPGQNPPTVKPDVTEGCADGFVFSGGACKKARPDLAHACAPDDGPDCEAQCEKGDATSCDRLGALVSAGKHGAADPKKALTLFEKACDGGYADGCTNLGVSLLIGGSPDPARAAAVLEKACQSGSARACGIAGELAMNDSPPATPEEPDAPVDEGSMPGGSPGKPSFVQKGSANVPTSGGPIKDAKKALRFMVKGCEGGNMISCTNAGFLYAGGGGASVPRDDKKALTYGRRACFGGNATACGNAGYKIELGQSVKADPKQALSLYDRACRLSPGECFRSGMLLSVGATGVAKDDKKAKALLTKSCASGNGIEALACVVGKLLYGESKAPAASGLAHVASIMKPQCDQKDARACTFLGIAEIGKGQKAPGKAHLAAACKLGDSLACALAKR